MYQNQEEENHLILRVPESLQKKIHTFIDMKGDKEIEMELIPKIIEHNGEQFTQFDFKYGKFKSTASIIELPCVIESQKTLDDINVFKTGNICQMVYVHPEGEKFLEQVKDFQYLAKKVVEQQENGLKEVRYLGRDGLTAPTKDIRNRFFRKEFPVSKQEIENVEKEMIQILRDMKDKNEIKSKKSKYQLNKFYYKIFIFYT